MSRLFFSVILLLSQSGVVAQDVLREDFENDIDSTLNTCGFAAQIENGAVTLRKGAGRSGEVSIESLFELVGAFSATVDASRIRLSDMGGMGLRLRNPSISAELFFLNGDQIHATIVVDGQPDFRTAMNAAAGVKFRIRRDANQTVFLEYEDPESSGFTSLHSAPDFTGTLRAGLFLKQESESSAEISGTFDNLVIEADEFRLTAFVRGDCNDDSVVDMSDVVCILGWLFRGSPATVCEVALAVGAQGQVDLGDALLLLMYLFQGLEPPRAPFPECGLTENCSDFLLGCENPTSCQ